MKNKIVYCKNLKCVNGENNTRKILHGRGHSQWCCLECMKIDKNLPLYCIYEKCNRGENGQPGKLGKLQNKFCSRSCQTSVRNSTIKIVRTEKSKLKHKETIRIKKENGTFKQPWNTGLTKEKNESLRTKGEKQSKVMKEKYASGEIIP